MPTTDHSDHLTGPQPSAPVLPIAELFAADLLPPRTPQSRSLARTAQRRLDELAADSQLAHATDQARAFLAASAMGNVATLSALAESCYQTAPAGATYYHAILRAYGIKAARGIAQF